MFDIKENLKRLPDKPGVYLHKDRMGEVIYVGKAVSLKNRVRQYFQSPANLDPKTRAMVSHIQEFEYIITGSEMEALILECNLIKRYMPKYNVLLRDDKTYPYLKVTLQDEWPRLLKTRRLVSDGARYFGPYADVGAVNQIIDLLSGIYRLKRCGAQNFGANFKPCLNYHINQCRGVCTGEVSREEYRESIRQVLDFLNGKDGHLKNSLREKMLKASEELRFEDAAMLRDQIAAVESISEKQRVALMKGGDMDAVLIAGNYGLVFFVRKGKLSGRENFPLPAGAVGSKAEVTAAFIKQYYSDLALVPKELLVEEDLPEKELLEEWLSELRGNRVQITCPQRGEKKALLDLARRDAIQMLEYLEGREREQTERARRLNGALTEFLNRGLGERAYPETGLRIESYDISNTGGTDSVGAMVVFVDGRPRRSAYRRFRIHTVEGPDDTGSLQEVLYRRFKRAKEGDPGFLPLPDVILMDGGKNQVHAAEAVAAAMQLAVPIAGMVKDDRHRTRALICGDLELDLKSNPALFHYAAAIQEEVHRFAVEYHRGLRSKRMQKSVLDEIPGIGEKRRNALLNCFGSVKKIAEAEIEELAKVPGMNRAAAESLKRELQKKDC